jgi:hypothetical protein
MKKILLSKIKITKYCFYIKSFDPFSNVLILPKTCVATSSFVPFGNYSNSLTSGLISDKISLYLFSPKYSFNAI